jgi:hypothetical protein
MITESEALSEICYSVWIALNKILHKNKCSILLDNIPNKANSDSHFPSYTYCPPVIIIIHNGMTLQKLEKSSLVDFIHLLPI